MHGILPNVPPPDANRAPPSATAAMPPPGSPGSFEAYLAELDRSAHNGSTGPDSASENGANRPADDERAYGYDNSRPGTEQSGSVGTKEPDRRAEAGDKQNLSRDRSTATDGKSQEHTNSTAAATVAGDVSKPQEKMPVPRDGESPKDATGAKSGDNLKMGVAVGIAKGAVGGATESAAPTAAAVASGKDAFRGGRGIGVRDDGKAKIHGSHGRAVLGDRVSGSSEGKNRSPIGSEPTAKALGTETRERVTERSGDGTVSSDNGTLSDAPTTRGVKGESPAGAEASTATFAGTGLSGDNGSLRRTQSGRGTKPGGDRVEGALGERLERVAGRSVREKVQKTDSARNVRRDSGGETPVREILVNLSESMASDRPGQGGESPTEMAGAARIADLMPGTSDRGSGIAAATRTLARELNGTLGDRVVRQAQVMLQDAGRAEVRLIIRPPELGRIRIQLQMDNGHIAGRILVDNGSVREVVEQNLAALQRAFAEAGLEMGDLEVSSGDAREGHGDERDATASSGGTPSGVGAHDRGEAGAFDRNVQMISEYEGRHRVNLVA